MASRSAFSAFRIFSSLSFSFTCTFKTSFWGFSPCLCALATFLCNSVSTVLYMSATFFISLAFTTCAYAWSVFRITVVAVSVSFICAISFPNTDIL